MTDNDDNKKTIKLRTTKIKDTLKCKLSEKEILEYAERMADAQQEASELSDQFASLKKEWQGKIDAKVGESERIGGIIRAKYEHRQVECERQENFTDHIITVIRLDTDEIVDSRAMTDDEKQEIPFDARDVEVTDTEAE